MKLRETNQPTNPRRVYNLPGHAHFLTWCTHRRQAGLTLPPFNRWIVESLNRTVELHRFGMVAWVIMPEHLHVIVRPREAEYSISKFLQSMKQAVMRRAMKGYRLGELHPSQNWVCAKPGESPEFRLWQRGGGFDFNIYDPATMREKIEYIHNNPVRRGLVELPGSHGASPTMDPAGSRMGMSDDGARGVIPRFPSRLIEARRKTRAPSEGRPGAKPGHPPWYSWMVFRDRYAYRRYVVGVFCECQ